MSLKLGQIGATSNINPSVKTEGTKFDAGQAEEFRRVLEDQITPDTNGIRAPGLDKPLPATLKFSNHAVERMSQRGIHFTPEEMTKIENAARKAQEKGSRETLIVGNDAAMIVSLKTNTIVTVMDKSALKENVFTNIDSTVMI
jgi:flagellar operon protein